MKKLRLLLFSLLCFMLLPSLTSCLDDAGDPDYYNVAIGTLGKLPDGKAYCIYFDGKSEAYTVTDSTLIVIRQLQKPGQRVIATFKEATGRGDRKYIRLYDLYGVLTKQLAEKPKSEAEEKALGTDRCTLGGAWKGGGFINVKFSVPTVNHPARPHLINAYDTGVTDAAGYRILRFTHHLNGNRPAYWSSLQYVSFALPDVKPAPKGYRINYRYSDSETRTITVEE